MRPEHYPAHYPLHHPFPPAAPQQLGLSLDALSADAADDDGLPGLRLDTWLWRLPAAISNDGISTWLNRWSASTIPGRYPRWVTLVGAQQLPHSLLLQLRRSGLPALLLRPQPGSPLELLVEHALLSGKSDIVIAPMPTASSNWLQRYNRAASRGQARALLV